MPELNEPIVLPTLQEQPPPTSEPPKLEKMMLCTKYEAMDTAVEIKEGNGLHACVRKVHFYTFESTANYGKGTPSCEVVLRTLENANFAVGELYKLELK